MGAAPSTPGDLMDLSAREWELVHSTYVHHMQALERNEELGERRIGLLFTVASAAAVGVGLVAERGDAADTLAAAAGASLIVALFGLLTVMRLAGRNLATTDLINGLERIRREVAPDKNSRLASLFVYPPHAAAQVRTQSWSPIKGGLVDIAGCATAAFAGAAAAFCVVALDDEHVLGAVVAGAAIALGAWFAQVALVRARYELGQKTS